MVQGKILLLLVGIVKMVMMFAPCGDRGRPHHLLCLILLFLISVKPYLLYIRCYESVMVFAPGGDRSCPYQSVSVVVCTTVLLFLLCLL